MGEPGPAGQSSSPATPRPAAATVEAARGAELLVHDASFSEEEAQRAADTGHSTVGQAAAVAREAGVRMLALVHISSRYHVGKVLEEAREVYEPTVAPRDFDLVEIPFPERGEPELVANGARERREVEEASLRRSRRATASAIAAGWSSWGKCLAGSIVASSTPSARITASRRSPGEHPVIPPQTTWAG